MSITKELREYADMWNTDRAVSMCIHSIANRIDAAHKREVDEARMDAFAMPNHRVALPMDADGVPIDLGDEVYYIDNATETHETHFTVTFFTLYEDGWEVNGCKPSRLRHWEGPTVDKLLMQFVFDAADTASVTEMAVLVDDYADRIREAVRDEEDK